MVQILVSRSVTVTFLVQHNNCFSHASTITKENTRERGADQGDMIIYQYHCCVLVPEPAGKSILEQLLEA